MDEVFNSLDSLFVTNPVNIHYLTGFVSVTPEREAYVLLTMAAIYFFATPLYTEKSKSLKSKLNTVKIEIINISKETPLYAQLMSIASKLDIKTLGFEADNLTFEEFQKISAELPGVNLVPTKGRIEALRMIKREDEINSIRKAAELTDACFSFIKGKLEPGITEAAIAWEIEAFIKKRGGKLSFCPIVAFGKNSSQPHHSPGSDLENHNGTVLSRTDLILLDFGARIDGYCADLTRVVFMGEPAPEWRRAYETVQETQASVLKYMKDNIQKYHMKEGAPLGLSGNQLDRMAKSMIETAGFPAYTHSLGHSVGLEVHESPRLSIKSDAILRPGMVVTIEPAIYKEGQYGIRIEDLVLIKSDNIEILSQSPKKLLSL